MKKQINPLRRNMKGAKVQVLHQALQQLGYALDKVELKDQYYGKSTSAAIKQWQEKNQLKVTGELDSRAAALLEVSVPQLGDSDQAFTHRLIGTVQDKAGKPLANLTVEVRDQDQTNDDLLGKVQSNAEGVYALQFDEKAYKDARNDMLPDVYFNIYEGKTLLHSTKDTVQQNLAQGTHTLHFTVQPVDRLNYDIQGMVTTPQGRPLANMQVQVWGIHLGNKTLLKTTQTNAAGAYNLEYLWRMDELADVQIQVVDEQGAPLEQSPVLYGASLQETVNLSLPANSVPEPNEYQVIHDKIQTTTGDLPLHNLQENDQQQDISYLAKKTKVDARLIAMLALADQYQQTTQVDAPLYYALFRATQETDAGKIHQLTTTQVQQIWETAIEENRIAPMSRKHLARSLELFQTQSTQQLLQQMAPQMVSSLEQMLELSLSDQAHRNQFVDLYQKTIDKSKFWNTIKENMGENMAQSLQLDYQLGSLTFNNAPLIRQLKEQKAVENNPLQLVQKGLYQTAAWEELLTDDIAIPVDFADKAQYARYLTTQLKISYPTAVLAEQVQREEMPLTDATDRSNIAGFLQKHQDTFNIGTTPIAQYIRDNDLQVADNTLQALQRLQRVYQVTPSDKAMQVLLEVGTDSAQQIVQGGFNRLMSQVGAQIGPTQTKQIYAKAHQVYGTILHIATDFLTHKQNPLLPHLNNKQSIDTSDVGAYTTLEDVFGQMDFCTCSHCRSVLSPAAYLVDLLQFIDLPGTSDHQNPLDVLLQRRPDIQHLELSCENTNVTIPYIDLVNEVLEKFVVNGDFSGSLPEPLPGFEGFNIEENTSAEALAARPQNTLHQAYQQLKQQVYPVALPFNQPLAATRRLLDQAEVPLHHLMHHLCPHDELTTWQAVHAEYLEISPEEYTLFTQQAVPVPVYFGKPPAPDLHSQLLDSGTFAKDFTHSLSITYQELNHLLNTRMINPGAPLIPYLQSLEIPLDTIIDFVNGQIHLDDFIRSIPKIHRHGALADWLLARGEQIKKLQLLQSTHDTTNACQLADWVLQFADHTPLDEVAFLKWVRLVRLWKKLGWNIQETDQAIVILGQEVLKAQTVTELNHAFSLLITRLAHFKKSAELLAIHQTADRQKLLACFGLIDTFGASSLYHQLFLNPANTPNDQRYTLTNDDGNYLFQDHYKVLAHAHPLLAAFHLTSEQLVYVLRQIAPNQDPATVALTLENVTAIHRYSFLSRQLNISLEELATIIQLTQTMPWGIPPEVKPPIIHLIDTVQMLQGQKVNILSLSYFLRHEDFSANASPGTEDLLDMARRIKNELADIAAGFKVVDDPTGTIAKEKMAALYPAEVVEQYFALLFNTRSFSTPYQHHTPQLDITISEVLGNTASLVYNDFQKILKAQGSLSNAQVQALTTAAQVIPEENNQRQLFIQALAQLETQASQWKNDLFARYPALKTPYENYVSGGGFETLIHELIADFEANTQKTALYVFLANTLDTSPDFIQVLLSNHRVLKASESALPAVYDLLQLAQNGVTVSYKLPTGNVTETQIDDFSQALAEEVFTQHPLLTHATLSTYLEVPNDTDFYNFALTTGTNTQVTVKIGTQTIAGTNIQGQWTNTDPVRLAGGRYHLLEIHLTQVTDEITLRWTSEKSGGVPQAIPETQLYPTLATDRFQQTYARVLKAIGLLELLQIEEREVVFFCEKYLINNQSFLQALPLVFDAHDEALPEALWQVTGQLLHYQRLKASNPGVTEELLTVLKHPLATYLDQQNQEQLLLYKVTQWNPTQLDLLLGHFQLTLQDLQQPRVFYQVQQSYQLVQKLGVAVPQALQVAFQPATNQSVNQLENTLQIKYDVAAWYQVIRPINDALRVEQRDALVAYGLRLMQQNDQTKSVDTPEKLFEFFLIDVQMDACMKTSRIKQAIASIQLFIHRSLMNLEPQVSAQQIDAAQWEWMKRYRVWEANRKVFLYPENWLEPALRDNKSSFFQDLESELLESDITQDAAELALLHYLEKLDEVAKLEIVATHYEDKRKSENEWFNPKDDILHVFGRTAGAKRKYYYRRYEYDQWTPWEKIDLDIEDNPLLPVVWEGRLFLFWLNVMPKPVASNQKVPSPKADGSYEIAPDVEVDITATLSWSEYFNGQWQTRNTSDYDNPLVLKTLRAGLFQRGKLKMASSISAGNNLFIFVTYELLKGNQIFSPHDIHHYFKLYNKYSLPEQKGKNESHILLPEEQVPTLGGDQPQRYLHSLYLPAPAKNAIMWANYIKTNSNETSFHILMKPCISSEIVVPTHYINPYRAPFFYQNGLHTFFVETRTLIERFQETKTYEITPFPVYTTPRKTPKTWFPPQKSTHPNTLPDPIADPLKPSTYFNDPVPEASNLLQATQVSIGLLETGTVKFGEREIGLHSSVHSSKSQN